MGQVREDWLCHRYILHMVSGVSKNRILNTDLFVPEGRQRRKKNNFMSDCDTVIRNFLLKPDTRNLKPKNCSRNVIIKNTCGTN
jgi:hypothetical protein